MNFKRDFKENLKSLFSLYKLVDKEVTNMSENKNITTEHKEETSKNFIDRWNNGEVQGEEYKKIIDECLQLMDD